MEPLVAAISEVIFTVIILGIGYLLVGKDS